MAARWSRSLALRRAAGGPQSKSARAVAGCLSGSGSTSATSAQQRPSGPGRGETVRRLHEPSSRTGYLGRRGSEEECFWIKVQKTSGCWNWQAAKNQGYGTFRGQRAHRWAYEKLVGPIPEGLTIDHLCRNRGCVNPSHMEPVTASENARRATAA